MENPPNFSSFQNFENSAILFNTGVAASSFVVKYTKFVEINFLNYISSLCI